MKLSVRRPGHLPILLWAPLSILKWGIVRKASRNAGFEIDGKAIYKALKAEKKKCRRGRFVLVEAESPDGTKVKITL